MCGSTGGGLPANETELPSAIVVGGGLAGMAAALALGSVGFRVDLFEARRYLGGRASSFPAGDGTLVDNGQHVLLGCCRNLLDFYRRLGAERCIRFYSKFWFVEPGGRISPLATGRGKLLASFWLLPFLGMRDKVTIARALVSVRREYRERSDLDRITMIQWLREKRQSTQAIERFWRPVLVSGLNEEPERVAARHGVQLFWLGLLAGAGARRFGVPQVPLGELYSAVRWRQHPAVTIRLGARVERVICEQGRAAAVRSAGTVHRADYFVLAVPARQAAALAPELGLQPGGFEFSPIVGVHLWFDRPVAHLPHAALLGRAIQWVFDRLEGRYLLAVISAARGLLTLPREELVQLALRDLAEFLPPVRQARLESATVVREAEATFSAVPGLEAIRPRAVTPIPNLFLAGDWTRTGWPATMEGAVRSGYLAAEAVAAAAGLHARFLIPDPAP